ncbi:hypothetical protein [uncultured Roseobacter sp.]|uniref:hypothetical protein n=1 Tax=uncultured Roseobacter sp. TaxID=114847 RepID=UPI0026052A27|nr:hypothetical protein [uncultured Roseobacter sp.]
MKNAQIKSVSLAKVMERASNQLDLLAAQVFDLEETIGSTLSDDTIARGSDITRLQALDYLRQCLEDLALLTMLLNRDPKQKDILIADAEQLASKLKLEVTRGLLSPEKSESEAPRKRVVGDVDLF